MGKGLQFRYWFAKGHAVRGWAQLGYYLENIGVLKSVWDEQDGSRRFVGYRIEASVTEAALR